MAHGTLAPGSVSRAIRHRTVDEIWYVLGGSAEIWRRLSEHESIETVCAGDALTIPLGTHFQFRTVGPASFTFIMCTMPPWSGEDEAIRVDGIWTPTLDPDRELG
jgi:mannose-6-phosphate isomerase-like protein (cupin superfamily)